MLRSVRPTVRPSVCLPRLLDSVPFARCQYVRVAASNALDRGQHGRRCPRPNTNNAGGAYHFAVRYLVILTVSVWMISVKLAFHGDDTDTDTDTNILADLSERAIFLARILARMSVRDARLYTCTRVLYTISGRAHVYKITQ